MTESQPEYASRPCLHPRSWSTARKLLVVLTISFYTLSVYGGSAIYIISIPSVMQRFNVSDQTVQLGLSLYIVGYGIGPMLWAPLSEVPWIGRKPVYLLTAVVFLAISAATATVNNLPTFFVLRALQGFFGSPCLANGGASLNDVFEGRYLAVALSIWVAFAYAGPALGPVLASHTMFGKIWHVSMWEIFAFGGATILLIFAAPETFEPKLRYVSNPKANNIEKRKQMMYQIYTSLLRPVQISLQDPAINFINIYTSYLYGCYYTFFDGFPLVYIQIYGFSTKQLGLSFLPIMVGCLVGCAAYISYLWISPKRHSSSFSPETRLLPALLAVWLPPIGIFVFGLARPGVHWSVCMFGVVLYAGGVFIVLQCLSLYILDVYPLHEASLFAANDFSRSIIGAASVHIGIPLYKNLGVRNATAILAGISVLGALGLLVLYRTGEALRGRSTFVCNERKPSETSEVSDMTSGMRKIG